MLEQIGPQKLLEELKKQAPQYAKLLPELPALLTNYLKNNSLQTESESQILRDLLQEQQRTNKLLQRLMYAGFGFIVGLIVMQLVSRMHMFVF
jgi:ubiquinone biosynthesis protein